MASTAASQPQEASTSQPSLGELTADSPALLVVVNTAVLSISAAALGSTIGVLRQDPKNPALLLATKGAFNAAAAGFPFFACREYLVNPLLSQASSLLHQRQQQLKTTFASTSAHSTTQRHTNNLASSSISGLIIGAGSGLYYGWVAAEEARVQHAKGVRMAGAKTRYPKTNPIHTLVIGWQAAGGIRGLGTSAARLGFLAGAVQLGVNEVGVLLGAATADEEEQSERVPPSATAATAKPSSAPTPAAPAPSPTAEPAATPPWWSPARVWPLVRLTDDEYLARLEAQRAELLAEKAQLQRDIDQVVQGGNQGTGAGR